MSEVRQLVEDLVTMKRAAGFSWKRQEHDLLQFADLCERMGHVSGDVSSECVDRYVYGAHVRATTVYKRELLLAELGDFARARGFSGAHVCKVGGCPHWRPGPPYIFTDEEVRRLFAAIDGRQPTTSDNRGLVDPVLFRVLYGTGVRVSECLGLAVGDFDPVTRSVTVRGGKNGRDRVLPVTDRLAATVDRYIGAAHPSGDVREALFYTRDPRRAMDRSTVYVRFREYLLMADIPHFRDGGPKVHSLRHGFAVGCLRRWAREGADVTAKLPRLMGYMGHGDLRATEYYLRLTAELYPGMVEQVERECGWVVPS